MSTMMAAFDSWLRLQANRTVAGQLLKLAEHLKVPDSAEWAARMLAQSPSADRSTVLRTAQMMALGTQLASPQATTAKPVLSVAQIRQLARSSDAASWPASQARANELWSAALPVLQGTDLIQNGRLTAPALQQLSDARRALAQEVDQPRTSISPATAALKVAGEYWTKSAGSDDAAFKKATHAQNALTQAMAPLRAQASQVLDAIRSEYQTTLASIRVLKPDFQETTIGATEINGLQLSRFESATSRKAFAKLKLDVAKQYLAQYQQQARLSAPAPANDAAQVFIAQLTRDERKSLEMQLIGGPTLSQVVSMEAQRGGELTFERIQRAVYVLLPNPLLPQFLRQRASTLKPEVFYEIQYEGAVALRQSLYTALVCLSLQPMQIRTADGSRRLDIYRHGAERSGTTIIDQRDGSALPQPNGDLEAILTALDIKADGYGALVISYGSSDKVQENHPRIYPDPSELISERAAEQKLSPSERLSQIDRDYTSVLRKLDSAGGVPMDPDNTGRVADVSVELNLVKTRVIRVAADLPQSIGHRGEIPAAAEQLARFQATGWFQEALEDASGERLTDPPTGQSVTERRLATIRELIRETPDLPDNMKGPLGEAKFLVVALMQYADLHRDDSLVSNGTLTQTEHAQMLRSPRKYFDFLRQNQSAWQKVVIEALRKN